MNKEDMARFRQFKEWIKNLANSEAKQAIITLQHASKETKVVLLLTIEELLFCLESNLDWKNSLKGVRNETSHNRTGENILSKILHDIENTYGTLSHIEVLPIPYFYLEEIHLRSLNFWKTIQFSQAKDITNHIYMVFYQWDVLKKYKLEHNLLYDTENPEHTFQIPDTIPHDRQEKIYIMWNLEKELWTFIQAYKQS